jgi:hypothetical protein
MSALAGILVLQKTLQRSPAWVRVALEVLVRLDVQVLAAHGAEPSAVLSAEDLLGKLESDRIARPRTQLELAVGDVVRVQLVRRRGVEVVELARADRAPASSTSNVSVRTSPGRSRSVLRSTVVIP